MSRIVVTALGTLGDLHPIVAVALELRERGHDVAFVTHQVYQTKITALRFEFHAMRPDFTAMIDPEEMARIMDLKTGQEYLIGQWLNPNLREMYADLFQATQGADFIVSGEGVIVTPLVAEKLGIRWATVVLSPLSFLSVYDPPTLALPLILAKLYKPGSVIAKGTIGLMKFVSRFWATPIRQLRQELNLSVSYYNPFVENRFSPYLVVALFSKVVGQPQPDWAVRAIASGFTFYDGTQEGAEFSTELKQFLAAGEPPIVFTLGSAVVMNPGDFYSESIAAARQLNRRAVLLIGDNVQMDYLSTDEIAVNYAPYSQIFPCACAIVHQGGIGTTAQALRAGRPTLIVPYSQDQPDNAARVERLGTSRTIERKYYQARRVAQELSELLEDPSYATKASEIGQIIHAEDGVTTACDAIEKQLRSDCIVSTYNSST
jgi:rhamnosyltransferase subunit B